MAVSYPSRNGAFLDLGQLWVRYDTIGTIKPSDTDGEPSCLVVLTIPGYKTLRVGCDPIALLTMIQEAANATAQLTGKWRGVGLRG